MSRELLSTSGVLNEAGDLVARVAAPWAGILFLTALPFRLLQVRFIFEVAALGGEARHYGHALLGLAFATTGTFLLALGGRAVFVRACGLAASGAERRPGLETLRLNAASFLGYLYVSLLLESIFIAFAFTGIAVPIVVILSGLAAATSEMNDRPGLLRPLAAIARAARSARVLCSLFAVFSVAVVASFINLYCLFLAGIWLAGGVPGLDLTRWHEITRPMGVIPWPSHVLLGCLLVAGALSAVEPFWLAANVVTVRRARALQSGSDLRRWFLELQAGRSR